MARGPYTGYSVSEFNGQQRVVDAVSDFDPDQPVDLFQSGRSRNQVAGDRVKSAGLERASRLRSLDHLVRAQ
jgi:hypothetical protein